MDFNHSRLQRRPVTNRVDKPYHLLLADDDSGFRETVRSILAPYFRMLEAGTGEEAIEIVEGHRVDIALLDMHMHVMTGLETLQRLKSLNAIAPGILITADANDSLRRRALQADAYSVLAKPVSKTELLTTVSTALEDAYDDSDVFGVVDG